MGFWEKLNNFKDKINEVEHNIFETADTESDYLQVLETYGQYEEKDESVDPDFIRR